MAKKNKRNDGYLSIRKKLIAAIAMLLVASFMVASSSYAWFTLSTAPEVKGIQTAVGANGSLEIALRTESSMNNITSGVGDSGNYTTWGNLVDLSDSKFGLQSIYLMPARLNFDEVGTFKGSSPLQTPVYGADGRIEKLDDGSTMLGSYHSKDGAFKLYNAENASVTVDNVTSVYQTEYGVRAIGNSTALTQQQIDYRNAQVAAAMALNYARTNVSESLTATGSDLANVAVTKAMGGTSYNITAVQTMHDKLDAAIAQLEEAIRAFAKADYAQKNASAEKEAYETGRNALLAKDLYEIVNTVNNTTLTEAYALYECISEAVSDSKDAYTPITDKSNTDYNTAYAVLLPLADIESVTINGYKSNQVMNNVNNIANSVTSGAGVNVVLQPADGATDADAGVYVNFAKLVGNFDVAIVIPSIEYGGINLTNIKAKMKTEVTGAPTVNIIKTGTFPAAPTASESSATSAPLNDVYGYMLDFAFRTNAVNSNLMLQTSATDRIYSSGGSQATQGGGSTMSFSSISADFTTDDVKELMAAIRIVFINNGTILQVAGLNTNVANTIGKTVTAPIQIYDPATYTVDAAGFRAKDTQTITFMTPDAKGATALMALSSPNTAYDVSVLVYLDGDVVTNALVANAEASMVGSMNLQFSSSAELKPMSYAPLQDPTSGALNRAVPSILAQGGSTTLPTTIMVDGVSKNVAWSTSTGATLDGNTLNIAADAPSTVTVTATYDTDKTAAYIIQIIEVSTPVTSGGDDAGSGT